MQIVYSIVEKKLKLFDDVTLPLKKEKGKFETKKCKNCYNFKKNSRNELVKLALTHFGEKFHVLEF